MFLLLLRTFTHKSCKWPTVFLGTVLIREAEVMVGPLFSRASYDIEKNVTYLFMYSVPFLIKAFFSFYISYLLHPTY